MKTGLYQRGLASSDKHTPSSKRKAKQSQTLHHPLWRLKSLNVPGIRVKHATKCDQSGPCDRWGSQSGQAALGREPIISRFIAPADTEGWGRVYSHARAGKRNVSAMWGESVRVEEVKGKRGVKNFIFFYKIVDRTEKND